MASPNLAIIARTIVAGSPAVGPAAEPPPFIADDMIGRPLTPNERRMFIAAWESERDAWFDSHTPPAT